MFLLQRRIMFVYRKYIYKCASFYHILKFIWLENVVFTFYKLEHYSFDNFLMSSNFILKWFKTLYTVSIIMELFLTFLIGNQQSHRIQSILLFRISAIDSTARMDCTITFIHLFFSLYQPFYTENLAASNRHFQIVFI